MSKGYGRLDNRGPTKLIRSLVRPEGWGWLLFPFLQKINPVAVQQMEERVAREGEANES